MSPPVRWTAVEVLSVVGNAVTVGTPDEHGGMATLVLEPPHVQPHFLPDVGSTARLLMVGPVPFLYPDAIGADAVTAREIIAGAITAEHITASAIDGKTITGAIVRTAATAARIVLQPGTGGLAVMDMFGPLSTTPSRLTVAGADAGYSQMILQGAQDTPGTARIALSVDRCQLGLGTVPTVDVTAAGVGFNNTAPIGKRTVDAAATDLPTAIALLNQIRQWGIDAGFLQ